MLDNHLDKDHRSRSFMQPYDVLSQKKRKELNSIELRRNKRLEIISKMRYFSASLTPETTPSPLPPISLQDLDLLVNSMKSPSNSDNLLAARGFRKLLESDPPPIRELIDYQVLPYLRDWVQRHNSPELQYESTWALINISSNISSYCEVLVENKFIPVVSGLLKSENLSIRDHAVWILGNLGGDCCKFRDIILESSAWLQMIDILACENQNIGEKRRKTVGTSVFAITNLCRCKPMGDWNKIKLAIPVLSEVFSGEVSHELLLDMLWAFNNITESNSEGINALLSIGLLPSIIRFANHSNSSVVLPAVKILGNIVAGSTDQSQWVMNLRGSHTLNKLLLCKNVDILKECIWAISNICAGDRRHLEELLNIGVITKVMVFVGCSNLRVRIETVWTLGNAVGLGSAEQIERMVRDGIIEALCSFLEDKEIEIIAIALEGLKKIIQSTIKIGKNEKTHEYVEIIKSCDAIDRLEKLQRNKNSIIFQKSTHFLDFLLKNARDQHC